MDKLILALGQIPNIAWQLGRCWKADEKGQPLYHGDLYETTEDDTLSSTLRSHRTENMSDPHDVLLTLYGIAIRWEYERDMRRGNH